MTTTRTNENGPASTCIDPGHGSALNIDRIARKRTMNSTTTTKPATFLEDTFGRIAVQYGLSEILATSLDIVKAAVQQRDPSIVEWYVQTAVDDEADVAFALTGLRKPKPTDDDPLVAAIAALRAGMAEYDREAPRDEDADARAAATFEPPLEALIAWDQPATSMAGAIAALQVVDQVEWLPGGLKLALAMNKAALRYLEGRTI